MGMAKVAELNGYPGPRHVLDLAAQLKLTPEQRQEVQAIYDPMTAAAKPRGAELVERVRWRRCGMVSVTVRRPAWRGR